MTTDNKTLADVQPGGRVRLGDQAERARFEAWMATQIDQGSEHVMAMVSATDDRYQSPITSSMWSAWQAASAAREGGRINGWRVIDGVRVYSAYAHASILDDQLYVRYEDYLAALSAQPSPATCKEGLQVQPSPGGQGDSRIPFEAWAKDGGFDVSKFKGIYNSIETRAAWEAWLYWQRLAARQPVSEADAYQQGFRDGQDRTCTVVASQPVASNQPSGNSGELDVDAARQPVGEPDEPIFQIKHHDDTEATWRDATEDAYEMQPIALRRIVYAAPPAQAVDLGQFREPIAAWSKHCAHSFKGYESYQDSDLPDWMAERRQQVRKCGELLALIDSHTAGGQP